MRFTIRITALALTATTKTGTHFLNYQYDCGRQSRKISPQRRGKRTANWSRHVSCPKTSSWVQTAKKQHHRHRLIIVSSRRTSSETRFLNFLQTRARATPFGGQPDTQRTSFKSNQSPLLAVRQPTSTSSSRSLEASCLSTFFLFHSLIHTPGAPGTRSSVGCLLFAHYCGRLQYSSIARIKLLNTQ